MWLGQRWTWHTDSAKFCTLMPSKLQAARRATASLRLRPFFNPFLQPPSIPAIRTRTRNPLTATSFSPAALAAGHQAGHFARRGGGPPGPLPGGGAPVHGRGGAGEGDGDVLRPAAVRPGAAVGGQLRGAAGRRHSGGAGARSQGLLCRPCKPARGRDVCCCVACTSYLPAWRPSCYLPSLHVVAERRCVACCQCSSLGHM